LKVRFITAATGQMVKKNPCGAKTMAVTLPPVRLNYRQAGEASQNLRVNVTGGN
jgi:hypothetical protein